MTVLCVQCDQCSGDQVWGSGVDLRTSDSLVTVLCEDNHDATDPLYPRRERHWSLATWGGVGWQVRLSALSRHSYSRGRDHTGCCCSVGDESCKWWDVTSVSSHSSVNRVNMETCNVLVLGERGSGKTCLINRFLTGQFIHNQVCVFYQYFIHSNRKCSD